MVLEAVSALEAEPLLATVPVFRPIHQDQGARPSILASCDLMVQEGVQVLATVMVLAKPPPALSASCCLTDP
jgi:hypothetical protein